MHQPDPYAGQYPPPPPMSGDNHSQLQMSTPQLPQELHQHAPQPQPHEQNVYQYHQEYQSTPVFHTPEHQAHYDPRLSYDTGYLNSAPRPHDEESNLHGKNEYSDPNSQTLEDYLRQEREERERQQQVSVANESPYKAPASNTSAVNDYTDEYENHQSTPEKTPMVSKPFWKKDKKKKEDPNDRYNQPFYAKPTHAPENEAETYKRPLDYNQRSRCNCCCYNPAMTCCSCFCMLISIAFVAAGIALIIASKVITNNCNNKCSDIPEEAQAACGTICSKVLHDGMFYGGIVVAGLAGIAVLWRGIMWTCAGCSQRR